MPKQNNNLEQIASNKYDLEMGDQLLNPATGESMVILSFEEKSIPRSNATYLVANCKFIHDSVQVEKFGNSCQMRCSLITPQQRIPRTIQVAIEEKLPQLQLALV